jgi:hypothetical protein
MRATWSHAYTYFRGTPEASNAVSAPRSPVKQANITQTVMPWQRGLWFGSKALGTDLSLLRLKALHAISFLSHQTQ